MKPGEASQTAEFNALFRAIETFQYPQRRRLFEKPSCPMFSRKKRAEISSFIPFAICWSFSTMVY